jgi:hypothetical protein
VRKNVWGNLGGVYADLRRESEWRNFDLVFFGGLSGSPRGCTEEGGQIVCLCCAIGGVLSCEV